MVNVLASMGVIMKRLVVVCALCCSALIATSCGLIESPTTEESASECKMSAYKAVAYSPTNDDYFRAYWADYVAACMTTKHYRWDEKCGPQVASVVGFSGCYIPRSAKAKK